MKTGRKQTRERKTTRIERVNIVTTRKRSERRKVKRVTEKTARHLPLIHQIMMTKMEDIRGIRNEGNIITKIGKLNQRVQKGQKCPCMIIKDVIEVEVEKGNMRSLRIECHLHYHLVVIIIRKVKTTENITTGIDLEVDLVTVNLINTVVITVTRDSFTPRISFMKETPLD
jgi:hypothetical protein